MIPKPKLSTILISIGLFFFFLMLLFPYQNLRGYIFSRIQKESGIIISADELYPSFFGWPGISMKNASVTVPAQVTQMGLGDLELFAKKVTVRVGIAHLFPPTPSISLYLRELKKGGDLYLKVAQTSTTIESAYDADGVELAQLLPSGVGEVIHGFLSGDGAVDLNQKDPSKSAGKFQLKFEKFKLEALNVMGTVWAPIDIGPASAKLQIKNGTVEIPDFKLGTPKSDLSGTLTGDVRLGQNMMQDFLNLTLRLTLSESYRNNPQSDTMRSFLSSYQITPGNYAMRWQASIYEMSTNTFKALPQKATP